jgi:predicted transcriptional regulator
MDINKKLLEYGKEKISIEDLTSLLNVNITDLKAVYMQVEELVNKGIISPVKASGKNGNLTYPLYKRYHITLKAESNVEDIDKIKHLHPTLQKSGYLISHPGVFHENEEIIKALNKYTFLVESETAISRKERSYEIFGKEKVLDDSAVKSLLRNLQIGEKELRFYDTPEYCFHDYIPVRKNPMTLLICENKDIWFNIRRCMFEEGFKSLFGISIDGVVYGNGNKVSQKQGALAEYVRFMGNPKVRFLYWGDIDREGFDIYRRTKEVNPNLEIFLFVSGYEKMIERARNIELEDSPSSKKEGKLFNDLFSAFSYEDAIFLKETLAANKLIPQEIISYKFLSER